MKKISKLIASLALIVGFSLATATAVSAVNVYEPCASGSDSAVCNSTDDNINSIIGTVVDLLIYAIGITSVIVIIVSGFTYVTADGKQEQITKAKNTLTYAIVGLVIAILAYAIVNYVLKWLT